MHSPRLLAASVRAGKDGAAAADAIRGKRSRYFPSGGEIVPSVVEAGGRLVEETVVFVRAWGLELDQAVRPNDASQQCSTAL